MHIVNIIFVSANLNFFMHNNRPILIVEDDVEEQELLTEVFKSLPYPVNFLFVNNGEEALEFLRKSIQTPQLIISDVNMPGMSGLEFKNRINNDKQLNELRIPFIFFSGAGLNFTVTLAYQLNIQGFFIKGSDIVEIKADMFRIIDYWRHCQIPNNSKI